jgi:polysaccharide biosynthesis protein PslH
MAIAACLLARRTDRPKSMRIAWVCPYLPWPENSGGRIRIAQISRAFPDSELHLYVRSADDDPDLGQLGKLEPWRSIHAERSRWPARAPFGMPALPLSFPAKLMRLLGAHDVGDPFDAVIIEHSYSAHGLPRFRKAAALLSEHNIESQYWLHAIRSQPRFAFRHALEYLRWRRYESQVWRRTDAISVVSEADRLKVLRVRPDTGVVVPNGAAIENFSFRPPSERQSRRILFVGLLSYMPNVAAAKILATRVMPQVRRRFPDATLTLAGRDPRKEVRELASDSVTVTGTVADIAAIYADHAAFASPIGFGAGSSLKVLETLAAGVPLVCSRFSVRGFELQPETHYLPADSPEELATAICRVLEQPAAFDAMSRRGRQIAEHFSWSRIRKKFADLVHDAVEAKRREAARD